MSEERRPAAPKSAAGRGGGAGRGGSSTSEGRAVVKRTAPGAVAQRKQMGPMDAAPGYTARAIQPAKNNCLISVARAMHGPNMARNVQELFAEERDAALLAVEMDQYVVWRCPDFEHDCQRIPPSGRCFCMHSLSEHKPWDRRGMSVECQRCPCKSFAWVPSKPEHVGEFWLRKRPNFIESEWRAKCKCKHSHEEHDLSRSHKCKSRGCGCSFFSSSFVCAACDRSWELHETVFEVGKERRDHGRQTGEEFLPFSEVQILKNMVLYGTDSGEDTLAEALGRPPPGPGLAGPHSVPPPAIKRAGNDQAFGGR